MAVPLLPKNGSLTFTVSVTVAANTSGTISNLMVVTAPGDPQPSNNAAAVQTNSYIVVSPLVTRVTLQSDSGDYIGQGGSYSYTPANASISANATGGHLSLQVAGDQNWYADFQLPSSVTQFRSGTYGNLTRYPLQDAAVGGLSWTGEGRGCNTLQGSFTVYSATYSSGQLTSIDLSFEQHCEGGAPALHGQIRWSASDTTQPAGPVNPPPSGLWAPSAGATPATGNYVYLNSDVGDYIGAAGVHTYTLADAVINVNASGRNISVSVNGDESWSGTFQVMNSLTQSQAGYYGSLQRYPFNNPTKGGLDWSGEGRACNTLTGWFVIDNISFSNGSLDTLDLRFEQHCEGAAAALHGKIHWVASDATTPAGPVNPPPAGLWTPSAGATPAIGNYMYLVSDAGDYIGQGQINTYTPSNATLDVTSSGGTLNVNVGGWSGTFQAMNILAQLQPGYYGNLQRYPFHNPALGGLIWDGNGRGCNTLNGWFTVDSVTYTGAALTAIDLRFEQHCEGNTPALHGKLHWTSP